LFAKFFKEVAVVMPSKPNILIVDDELRMCNSLELILSRHNYQIKTANDVKSAIDKISHESFDLILTDIVMDDSDGFQVMDHINRHNMDTVVVMMTGFASTDTAVEALRKGAYDYIRKPFETEEVINTIENALSQRRLLAKQKEAEEELRESEQRFRALVETIPHGIQEIDTAGRITFSNPAHHKIWGYSEAELKDKTIYDLAVSDEAGEAQKEYIAHLVIDQPEPTPWFGQDRRKDGQVIDVQVDWNYKRDKDGKVVGLISAISDITERKKTEKLLKEARAGLEREVEERTADLRKANEQLIRSERLAATGQLAASIAHEINSPLQAISVLLSSMGKQYRDDAHLIENIDILKQAIGNIRDTVRSLLDLNRPGMELKQPGNINEVIRQTLTLARNLLKRNRISVQLDLSPEIPNIYLSPQQMYQMFLNLINNAIEGMTAPIEHLSGVPREENPKKEIRISSKIESDQIFIRISDTGPGIPEKDLQYLFDPFFTSKKKMGLGVGLSICYGIVEEHNGSIVAENDPESGAVFTIRLPLRAKS